jgi:hypothetical protein
MPHVIVLEDGRAVVVAERLEQGDLLAGRRVLTHGRRPYEFAGTIPRRIGRYEQHMREVVERTSKTGESQP